MINHELKLIYARVACTASCTLKCTLDKQNVSFDCVDSVTWKHDPDHVSLKHICEHINHHDKYFKFTIVRNPYDRLVSAYHFYHDWYKYTYREALDMCFSQFVHNLYHSADWYSERVKYTDQHSFVEGYNYAGRFENLHTSYLELCERINITPIPLVITNHIDHWGYTKSPRLYKNYQNYYNTDTKKLATLMNEQDLHVFGYSF